jgi:hypothetical protein
MDRMGAAGRLLVVAALVTLVTACGDSHALQPTVAPATPTPFPTISGSPTPASDLKPAIHGLVDRDGPPSAAYQGVVNNFVVNVHWSDIQPQPGPLVGNNAIDQAITEARQMNTVTGQPPVGIKIRLYTGVYAPSWAKALGGGPVAVAAGSLTGTVGRFWTNAFGSAYADVWTRLAQKYDSVPEIREITVSRCMTFYAETLIRDTSDPTTGQNLINAGFSLDADRTCITQEIDLGSVWHKTRIGMAFNPYEDVVPGLHLTDEAFTEQMMQYCRTKLGPQCVLENNSIRFPPQAGMYALMYAAITRLGAPISFQTATLSRIGDLTETLNWAVTAGASAVELPAGYTALPVSTLGGLAAALPVSAT